MKEKSDGIPRANGGSVQRSVSRRRTRKKLCKMKKQEIAEIPPGLEWCRQSALRIISMSQAPDFQNGEIWAKWCRSVAGAGLMQDPARLEWLAKDVGYDLMRNESPSPRPITPDDVNREGDRDYDLGRKHTKEEFHTPITHAIVRIMSRCGLGDAWKKNEYPDLSNAIIELSNLLREPFTTDEAIEVAKQIGVAL